jgi:hypothetical protein
VTTLGLMVGFVLTGLVAVIVWLARNSASAHERNHRFHSELMCDYCMQRTREAGPSESHRRWPLRVLGERPPRGTG